jgi:hypothetical protein
MKRLFALSLLLSMGLAMSCARVQGSAEGTDPVTGTWVGDFGPAFYDRNTISVELKWDGKNLTGTIKPGDPSGRMYRNFQGFPIENASFDPATGIVKFEALYQVRGRRYFIEGKVNRNTFTGKWTRPDEDKDGDFKLTRKAS